MDKIQNNEPKKILVVDDEETIRSIFDMAITHAGHTGCYAESGDEALDILQDEKNIDVVYVDLNLPDMSGVELCSRIRADRPKAVINAITGYAPFFDITECYRSGFDDYLEKPIGADRLFTSIHKAVGITSKPLQKETPTPQANVNH